MTQFFTTKDGIKLAYQDEGAGLPLLCLAGLTRTMGDFEYLRPHLPQPDQGKLRLIRMDYRGRGASDWARDWTGNYTVLREAQDVLELLDHLGLAQVAILGTSRGGLIGMALAMMAKPRLLGLCLNDVGPVIERAGLERIADYVGRNPSAKTHVEMAAKMPALMTGFANVPPDRWLAEVKLHYRQTANGLKIPYDPALRDAFLASLAAPEVDLWPLFDGCAGLPLALIRGANSDLLSPETVAQMQARRPDMLFATIPDRAHIPFLDEAESRALIHAFLTKVA
jgi:pimeloyl-ACP methyl ester carboxylesterase